MPPKDKPQKQDDSLLMVKTLTEIVNKLIFCYEKHEKINLTKVKNKKNEFKYKINKFKHDIAAKNSLYKIPRLVDIISAIPEKYKTKLLPLLKAKPVRTASGIMPVAVMSKPHRCPHIATTGNICIYCPGVNIKK